MAGDRRVNVPSADSPNFQRRVQETLRVFLGQEGDPLDRGVTVRDLVDVGLAENVGRGNLRLGPAIPVNPTRPTTPTDPTEKDLTPPPTPTGLRVTGGIAYIFVEHDQPVYTQGHGHLRTHLYGAQRAGGQPAPVFAQAVELAQFSANVYAMPSEPATTWHVWIKWETVDGVLSADPAGGINGAVATTGQDVSLLLDALTGQITQSQLYQELGARIDLIDGPASLAGSVGARIAAEATARTTADGALAQQISQIVAASGAATYRQPDEPTGDIPAGSLWFDTDDGNKTYRWNGTTWEPTDDTRIEQSIAAIVTEATARADADTAEASERHQLTTRVNDHDTTLETQATSIDGLRAQYTVKIDNNGYVSGFGLASEPVDGVPFSSFGVRADRFWIAAPATPDSGYENNPSIPFIVQTTPTTNNGEPVPVGVYIKSAYIMGGSITGSQIRSSTIEDSHLINVTANKITTGELSVDAQIYSTGYLAGTRGWMIRGDGTAEFGAASIRGRLTAAQIEVTYLSSISGHVGDLTGGTFRSSTDKWWYQGGDGFVLSVNAGSPFFEFKGGSATFRMSSWGDCSISFPKFSVDAAGNATFAGSLSAATGTFAGSLSAATGTFSGSLSAATGTFSGTLTAQAINAVSTINIAGNSITVPVQASGTNPTAWLFVPPETLLQPVVVIASFEPGGESVSLPVKTVYITAGGSVIASATVAPIVSRVTNVGDSDTVYFIYPATTLVAVHSPNVANIGWSYQAVGGGATIVALHAKR